MREKSAAAAEPFGVRVNRRLPAGLSIYRVETGRAYARNGNCHSPTKRYRYDLYVGSKRIDTAQSLGKLVDYVWANQDDYREYLPTTTASTRPE